MRGKIALILLITLNFSLAHSQSAQQVFNVRMDSIIKLLDRIPNVKSDSLRMVLGEKTAQYFQDIMIHPLSWQADLSPLKDKISILQSQDKTVRVYTWPIPLSNDYYYIGFIQHYDKKSHQAYSFRLYDHSNDLKNPEKQYLSPDNWYGCVYYQIHTFKYKRKKIYVLLGVDEANQLINRKIVEFMTFRPSGFPRFGYDIRNEYGQSVKRLIFEYNNQASMLLTWNKDLKMIVFDHLSPSEPKFKGLPQFYGPDFSYDALQFYKGKFIYKINVDVRDKNLK